jgi:hypothetical protein
MTDASDKVKSTRGVRAKISAPRDFPLKYILFTASSSSLLSLRPPSIFLLSSAILIIPSAFGTTITFPAPSSSLYSRTHCADQTHARYLSSRCISVQHLLAVLVLVLHYAQDAASYPLWYYDPGRDEDDGGGGRKGTAASVYM